MNKRTLVRDITVLREILQGGLEPIPGPTLGWRLPEPKRRWRTTKQAVLGLVVGMKLMRFLSGRSLSAQLQPLISELRHSLPELQHLEIRDLERRVHVVESGQKQYVDSPRALEVLGKMLDAVLLQQPVDLIYLSQRRRSQHAPQQALRALDEFVRTKDVSNHPAMIAGHPDLVDERNYHSWVGSFLSQGCDDVQRIPGKRRETVSYGGTS